MRNIFTLLFLFILFTSSAQDGILDASYGTNGKQVTSTVANAVNERQKVVTTADGKILHAFGAINATKDFGLVRLNDDGSLDVTFGSGGVVYTDFGGDEVATAVTLQDDGKIIVAGSKSTPTSNEVFALARYLSNGALDPSFGTGGMVTTIIGSRDVPYALVENGGIIVAAGLSYNSVSGESEFALARYLNSGALDPSFSGDGKQTTSVGTIDAIRALAVQSDGKLVAAGSVSLDGSTFSFALARYNTNGSLDGSFNGSGIVTRSFSTVGNDIAYAVAVQNSTGKIYAAGLTNNGNDNDIAILSYSSAGVAEATFGINGVDTTDLGNTNDVAYSIALQADTKIIVAGITSSVFGSNSDFAIGRFNNNGTRDVNFGGNMNGFNIIDFGSNDIGYDITPIGSDIIFAGISNTNLASARLVNSSIILPVHILSFTASKQSSAVSLNWQTGSELDALAFEILRSNDGIHFNRIGTVAASGNSNSVKNYAFSDPQPLQPVGFYRLRIINRDGSVSYSKIVVIRFNSKSGIEAFPNPVRHVLNLQLVQPAGQVQVDVYDISGRRVRSISLRSSGSALSTTIDMSNLQKGVYLIRANEETIRVVKE